MKLSMGNVKDERSHPFAFLFDTANHTKYSDLNGRLSCGCAEGATEISPGLGRGPPGTDLPREIVPKIILPLLAKRGEGRGEESKWLEIAG